MESLNRPPIFCPFLQEINPHIESARQHVLEWVQGFRLVQKEAALQRFIRADFGLLAACTYPSIDRGDLHLMPASNQRCLF